MRRKVFTANWKMNHKSSDVDQFIKSLRGSLATRGNLTQSSLPAPRNSQSEQGKAWQSDPQILIAPPFLYIEKLVHAFSGTDVWIGAQNVHWEDHGAYTGEISVSMLKSVGAQFAIVGHSERRIYFQENAHIISKKVERVVKEGLCLIFCCGETLEQRKKGFIFKTIQKQLEEGFHRIENLEFKNCIVAYEPVWAIGTGENATPEQVEEVHQFIRGWFVQKYENLAQDVRIQYGGSVNTSNVRSFMEKENIDGVLVGGASLKAESFAKIVALSSPPEATGK